MGAARVSVALVMKATALVAVDLAIFPIEVWYLLGFPVCLWLLVSLNLVIIRAFLLVRPLGAFDYTFMAVSAAASIALTWLVSGTGFVTAVLALPAKYLKIAAVRWLHQLIAAHYEAFEACLGMMAGMLAFPPAWVAGHLVAENARRRSDETRGPRQSRLVTLAQGALIGTGLYFISTLILDGAGVGPSAWGTAWLFPYFCGMAMSPFLGAMMLLLCVRWYENCRIFSKRRPRDG